MNPANKNENYVSDWFPVVQKAVRTLDFGVVQIIVHDSRVVQIERTEKVRLDSGQSKVKTLFNKEAKS